MHSWFENTIGAHLAGKERLVEYLIAAPSKKSTVNTKCEYAVKV